MASLTSGTRIGPYEILQLVGAGGMGEVYRARDTGLDRDVAIKVLPEHMATDKRALSRFEREAKAVAALSHPNILAIYDVGTVDSVNYVVTELLEGETLRIRLNRLGEPDRVFDWLELAYRDQSIWLTCWLKVDPRLDPIHSDPRFSDLLRRIGVLT
jgi:serine/threonine protein kinase